VLGDVVIRDNMLDIVIHNLEAIKRNDILLQI
jgi:hypothetical protein